MRAALSRLFVASSLVAAACAYDVLGPAGIADEPGLSDAGEDAGQEKDPPDTGTSDPPDTGTGDDAGEDGGDAGSTCAALDCAGRCGRLTNGCGQTLSCSGGCAGGRSCVATLCVLPHWSIAFDEQVSGLDFLPRTFGLDARGVHAAYALGDVLRVVTCNATACDSRPVTISTGVNFRQPVAALDPDGQLRIAAIVSGSGVFEGTVDLDAGSPTLMPARVEESGREYGFTRLFVEPSGQRTVLFRSQVSGGLDQRIRLATALQGYTLYAIQDGYQESQCVDVAVAPDGTRYIIALDGPKLLVSQSDLPNLGELDLEMIAPNASSASIAASNSEIVIAYEDGAHPGGVTVALRERGTTAWTITAIPGATQHLGGGTAVAIDPDGTLTVTWMQSDQWPALARGRPGAWQVSTMPALSPAGTSSIPRVQVVNGVVHLLLTGGQGVATITYVRYGP